MPKKRSRTKKAESENSSGPVKVTGLAGVISNINDTYGSGTIQLGRDIKYKRIPRLPTGVFTLNLESGGGWPRGRLVHIFGPQSTSKSYLAYLAIRSAQSYCNWCSMSLTRCSCGAKDPIKSFWVDVEHSDDEQWRKRIGVDPDLFYHTHLDNAEKAMDAVDAIVRCGEVGIVVIDSIAALVPRADVEKSAEDGQAPGGVAKILSLGTRKWASALNTKLLHPVTQETWPNQTTIICLNQIRDKIGPYGGGLEPPGGHAIRHAAGIELKMSAPPSEATLHDSKDRGYGWASSQRFFFETIKNKTYPPRRKGSFAIDFKSAQPDNQAQILDFAIRNSIIQKNGAWYLYAANKWQGEEKCLHGLIETGAWKDVEKAVGTKASEILGEVIR